MKEGAIEHLETFRVSGNEGDPYGTFLTSRDFVKLVIVVSQHACGECVSVFTHQRFPTYEEMDDVKRLFWEDDDIVIQIYMPGHAHSFKPHKGLFMWHCPGLDLPEATLTAAGIGP